VLTDDITPFEDRKLWLLNGAHSMLAYVGSLRGCTTVHEAVTDEYCRRLLDDWWETCRRYLPASDGELSAYCMALADRFANPRLHHALAQIATDGSQKLPVRLLPVLRRERDAGRLPEPAVAVLAAWIAHLRGAGAPVRDVSATELVEAAAGPIGEAVPRVLAALDPALADDADLVAAVRASAAAS
jgi:fructuronate reductase